VSASHREAIAPVYALAEQAFSRADSNALLRIIFVLT
jgi:hypothetical protein